MAGKLQVARRLVGFTEAGDPVHYTTFGPGHEPPGSVAEWAEERIAAMGSHGRLPAGQVAARLLRAEGAKAVRAAVDAGEGLDEHGRFGVLRVLRVCKQKAAGYPPAAGHAGALLAAWTRKWGDQAPAARSPQAA